MRQCQYCDHWKIDTQAPNEGRLPNNYGRCNQRVENGQRQITYETYGCDQYSDRQINRWTKKLL